MWACAGRGMSIVYLSLPLLHPPTHADTQMHIIYTFLHIIFIYLFHSILEHFIIFYLYLKNKIKLKSQR